MAKTPADVQVGDVLYFGGAVTGWIVTAERTTPRPDPRPRLKEGG